ncbi:MAG: diaminohydroxyphosphoribosylaminopyrimidine deaminase, partial [Alphaproteobacteria bacterium]
SKEWVIPALLKGANAVANKAVLTTPQTLKIATNFDVDLTKITGTGRRGRISKADLVAAIENGGGSSGGKATIRKLSTRDLRATPLAIRMAGLLNVDMSTVSPTGHRGRIRRADVEAAANLICFPASPSVVKPAPLVARPDEAYEDRPLTAIRKVIAARLSQSKTTAPHFRVTMEIELDGIVLLRQSINKGRKDQKVSLNDIFVKAVALSLVASPDVNIQFDGTNIRWFKDAHVSVAVALPDGLMTPVVRHANRKSLLEISTEITEFGRKAKDGALLPDDFEGGSFTVSNMGMFGVEQFDAIINPPQGAILALGAGHLQKRPGAGGKDYTALVMKATLSADHRVIDGAVAARFMQVLKATIENPKTEIS